MKQAIRTVLAVAALAPCAALATTGYFSHGYGIKAKAMGGVGIALPQDALAAAANPAGMARIGNRVDFGAEWFRPDRGAETGAGSFDANGEENFIIPEFGYNRVINPTTSLGVSVYGNGGLNTTYDVSPLGGSTPAGVDLMQLIVAPTAAWKLGSHAFGVSLNLAYQRFKARGLEAFAAGSASPGSVTNRGYDDSFGVGVRLGWLGEITPNFSLGATYQTRTYMSRFKKYEGLFAERGDFDIPENYGVGVALKPMSRLTLAADVQRINYSDVKSVGNPSAGLGGPLGTPTGPGFGWRNTTVVKIGVAYDWSANLTLRGGFVTLRQPIPAADTFINIVAPGVVEDHVTLGASWRMQKDAELTAYFMHAFEKKVNGAGANLRMSQNALGIAYGWRY